MGNEQQSGSSHHFITDISNDENKLQTRQNPSWKNTGQIPVRNQVSGITTTKKPGWEIARDISMNILSRQATKLGSKQGTIPNLTRQQSITKKYSLYGTPTASKALPSYGTPRMPTEKEAAQIDISYELLCSLCEGPCIGDYFRCRVCIKAFHSKCLFEHGYTNDESFHLPRLAKQDWSCPECNDFTRLLSQDEIDYLIQAFEQIDKNKDGYIILEEFLAIQANKKIPPGLELFIQHNQDLGKKYFSLMDSTQQGAITWSDFVFFYGGKLIAGKDKAELTSKLTEKELVMAKNLFFKDPQKVIDSESNIAITREHFKRVRHDLMLLLEKKYGINFIGTIIGYEDDLEDTSEKISIMKWTEFLREISLLILFNRANVDIIHNRARRAAIPAHLSGATVVSRSNLPSIETNSPSRIVFTRINTPGTSMLPNISRDVSFRKHAKILEKLNQQNQRELLIRKQMGSSMEFSIVESIEEEEDINLPKLKPNARDDRKAITDPWTAVKELQQLRNIPILVRKTPITVIKI